MTEPRLYAVTPGGPVLLSRPPGEPAVHELYEGLSLGVYSGLRTYDHVRFLRLEDHLERTERSMELLGWRERLDRGAFRLALHEACAAWPEPESRVRFDVLAAPAERLGTAARSLLLVYPFEPVPAEYMARGVGLEVTRELEREDPLIKRAEFVQRRLPFLTGTRERFDSLMVDAGGHVLEGSTSNFFAVLESVLCTPEDGVLEGVTRRVVLELAEARGLRIRLGTLELDELGDASEAFLTSSSRHLVPVVAVGGAAIGDGRPGPVTRDLVRAYDEYAQREARPAL